MDEFSDVLELVILEVVVIIVRWLPEWSGGTVTIAMLGNRFTQASLHAVVECRSENLGVFWRQPADTPHEILRSDGNAGTQGNEHWIVVELIGLQAQSGDMPPDALTPLAS
jgi:hypothetical protein